MLKVTIIIYVTYTYYNFSLYSSCNSLIMKLSNNPCRMNVNNTIFTSILKKTPINNKKHNFID